MTPRSRPSFLSGLQYSFRGSGLGARGSGLGNILIAPSGARLRGHIQALDVRHTLRRISRAPGFTAVVVLTLSIGVGASTAVFSVVKTVLLDPLPYPDAGRLVRIVETIPPDENPRGVAEERVLMEEQRFFQWRALTKTLSQMAASVTSSATIMTADGASRAVVARVSPDIFPLRIAEMTYWSSFPV